MKKFFILLFFIVILIVFFYFYNNTESFDNSGGIIVIPIKAHLVIDDSGQYTSYRDEENIIGLFGQVNRIWKQSNIYFSLEEVVFTDLSFNAIPQAINSDVSELVEHKNYDKGKINVFFTQSLNNINGLAIGGINSALVADFTTVNDFRTTAHELGHLLELRHVEPNNMLMAKGRNGELLINKEIAVARTNALEFLQNNGKK